MSWIKRRGQTTPSPAPVPPVPMYNTNQHSSQQNQWQQQELNPPTNNWYVQQDQTKQAYGQVPYNQLQQTNYWQQPYPQNTQHSYNHNSAFQPPVNQHNMPQTQQMYQQLGYIELQNNPSYGHQATVNYSDNQPKADGDSWNWGWGDEDNSNVQPVPLQQNLNANPPATNQLAGDSWDWSVEEANASSQAPLVNSDKAQTVALFPNYAENFQHKLESNLNKIDPAIAAIKNENLTPQWSIESQVSQESSDEILHTSESDHKLSRSSTISHSPLGQDFPSEKQEPHRQYETLNLRDESYNDLQQENKEVLPLKASLPPVEVNPTPPLPPPQAVFKNNLTPPPPINQTPSPKIAEDLRNPYKRVAAVSHKAMNKFGATPFYQPPVFNQAVNLETLPDNSEQPDFLPQNVETYKTVQQWPDNNEIAPINDRNQYLETGQLSNSECNDYNCSYESTQAETSDSLPPPGLQRMVLGQMEHELSNDVTLADEPPPGLSRMVLGQTETNQPPGELRRLVLGECRPQPRQTYRYQAPFQDDFTETEVRSATIGADTRPVDTEPLIISNDGSSIENTNRDLDEIASDNRRESIEGQQQDETIAAITNSVRDLNVSDVSKNPVDKPKRSSRQESSDSEEHRSKSPKDRRRYDYDRHGGRRYSPSPDRYKDKDRRKYRDRRYNDDTDYYSDKERDRRSKEERDRREEYEKKYSSLKKDKDKSKKRRDPRADQSDYRDDRRNDYYYRRYEDDYDDRSRPSSRSDSMHNYYRERGHERERPRDRDRQRRTRDPYNAYMQGYGFDPYSPYYQQYQYHYYENLRRTNPQAYAEWYRKYYQHSAHGGGYGAEDRASVHSGRSSANDELVKDRYTRQSYYSQTSLAQLGGYYRDTHSHSISGQYGPDDSRPYDHTDSSLNYFEDTAAASQRLTPAKFSTAHIKASIQSGLFVKILPHYPLDGQNATVDVSNLEELLVNDDEYEELIQFPGPLVKGVTHKKTIIEYCENKIKAASPNNIVDLDSYVLMWELLILLLRQNGMVVGTDIAELLMKDNKQESSRRQSVISNSSSLAAEIGAASDVNNFPTSEITSSSSMMLKEETVTNKFREYLIYGSGKEALEWAMKHGLWGHALFLASKLDKRTYANVMTRFANGLTMNDPLQTLYQLLSGRVPAAVTCVADEKWGDWKPHLAMILSNTTSRPELDRKAITTLGDTLLNRGSIYAAQFCYLMAQVGFSRYGTESAKLVLLGSNHNKPFLQFAVNEAIHMTEVYEYACSLNDATFAVPEFLPYKYLLATRLADRGLLEKSLAYLESISTTIIQNPSTVQLSILERVVELADRIKYYDPLVDPDGADENGDFNINRPDNTWLKDLKAVQNDYSGMLQNAHESNLTSGTPDFETLNQHVYDQNLNANQETWQPQQQYQQQPWQSDQNGELMQQNNINQEVYAPEQYQEQQQTQFWPNQQVHWNDNVERTSLAQYGQPQQLQQQTNEFWNSGQTEDTPLPQITMPNQSSARSPYDESDVPKDVKKEGNAKLKPTTPKQEKTPTTGWFGGIWNKLSLRPKNQMKLPDDKNPTIVWDPEKKKWTNTEGEGDETNTVFKPPPKMAEMFPTKPASLNNAEMHEPNPLMYVQQATNNINTVPAMNQNRTFSQPIAMNPQIPAEEVPATPKSTQPNIFKMQRSRNVKNAYVDVFNPGGKTSNSAPLPAPDSYGAVLANTNQMNFFIPAPVTDPNAPMDFLTPAPLMQAEDGSQPPTYEYST